MQQLRYIVSFCVCLLIWFEIASLIIPELYDTKSYYQLIVSRKNVWIKNNWTS